MKNLYFFIVVLYCMFGCNNLVFANGWYNDFKISQLVFSRGADGLHIVYSGGTGNPNPDGCDNANMFIAPYTSSNPIREQMMVSGILAAYAANKNVKAYLMGCIGGMGGTTYPAIWYFYSM